MDKVQPKLMLIGCGSHAKRVYFPIFKTTEHNFGTKVKAVIDLKEKKSDVSSFITNYFSDVEGIYIDPFDDNF